MVILKNGLWKEVKMMSDLCKKVDKNIWTGRDDSAEGSLALRLFQTVMTEPPVDLQAYAKHTALLGFMCDEGVRINKGRVGAYNAPNAIRKAMANLASHRGHDKVIDLGNICFEQDLDYSQQALAKTVLACQTAGLKTLVLGGGHETAYGHGLGLYQSYPDKKIGIINFDAHLDIRASAEYSSGTPFKQLADYCSEQERPFQYLCVGASLAANTQALLQTADDLAVSIIWDTECTAYNLVAIKQKIEAFINQVDIVYLTVDLDVLPLSIMSAVSAPAPYGVELAFLIEIAEYIKNSQKLKAVDFVEFNPDLDEQGLSAKVAARFVWQLLLSWQS